jgi:ArsR family transcriptional regulator
MDRFAGYFKALANPHRLKIFIKLVVCCSPGGTCKPEDGMKACVGELGKDLGLAASTVSHHIKELHQAGLLKMKRSGQFVECWLEKETLRDLADFFAKYGDELFAETLLSRPAVRKERIN